MIYDRTTVHDHSEEPNQGRRNDQTLYSQKAFFWTLIAFITMIAIAIWEISLW